VILSIANGRSAGIQNAGIFERFRRIVEATTEVGT